MASSPLVQAFEKNQQAIAKVNREVEKAVGAQLEKLESLKAKDAEMRQAILEAMESNGVTKFDGDLITISYKKASKRTTFDSKKFKEERPKTYEKYLRTSDVKSSISIKVKA